MFKRIVLATDFSPHAAVARDVAKWLARTYSAHLWVVTVLEPVEEPLDWINQPPAVSSWKWQKMLQKQQRKLKQEKRDNLDQWVADLRKAGIEVTDVVREGDPDKEIVAVAQEVNADLIVMGSHSRRTFWDVVLGSVTAKVVAEAPCPVMVVSHRPPHSGTAPQRILVAMDFSAYAEAATRMALSLAQEGGHELAFVVVPDGISAGEAQQRLESRLEEARAKGLKVDVLVREGDKVKEICKAALDVEADIIVMGSHSESGVGEKILGSVTEGVTKCAPCPVLIISGKEQHITKMGTSTEATSYQKEEISMATQRQTFEIVVTRVDEWTSKANGARWEITVGTVPGKPVDAPKPVELLLTALAGCSIIGVNREAAARGVNIEGVEARVEGVRRVAEHPVVESAHVHLVVYTQAPEEIVEEIVQTLEWGSTVNNTLKKSMPVKITYEIHK